MKIKSTLLILVAFCALIAPLSINAEEDRSWTMSTAANNVRCPEPEKEDFYKKYSARFVETGKVLHDLWEPLQKEGESAYKNISSYRSGETAVADFWAPFVHVSSVILFWIVIPLVLIVLFQVAYKCVVILGCKICEKCIRLNIDARSEFFYFVAYLLVAYLVASYVTFMVTNGENCSDKNTFALGASITALWFILSMIMHFCRQGIIKTAGEPAAGKQEEPKEEPKAEPREAPKEAHKEDAAKEVQEENDSVNSFRKGILGFRIFDIMIEFDLSVILLVVFPFVVQGDWATKATVAGLVVIAIIVHELGHALIGKAFGNKVAGIRVNAFGGYTAFQSARMHNAVFVYLAGPLFNLILAVVASWLDWLILARVNLVLACFNLLPMWTMDGGWVLYAILRKWCTRDKARGISALVGCLVGISAIAYFIYGFCTSCTASWGALLFSLAIVLWLTASSFFLLGTLSIAKDSSDDNTSPEPEPSSSV